jgi:serine/threonine-protein kinase
MSAGHISLGGGRSATIISEIGRGGMGVVFRAVTSDGSTVAIKVLGSGSSSVSLARFEREQRLLASFSEAEGFVPLIEAGETQVDERTLLGAQATIVLFIVMPFLAGGTLRNRIESGPMDVADVIEIGRALATALGHAHARGVVHRDLKPENVLFTDEGQPLVADLGLAKHFTREAHGASRSVSLSVEGQVRGTVGYMPPEQMADSSSVGPTADVYAIGIMLYECLTGRGPHPGDSALERLTAAQAGRVDRLRDLRPETPPWLARVVERCFAPTPERRFADARALLDALDGKSAGRRTGAVAALVLALVASGGLLALATRTRAKPSPVAPPAAGPAKTASPAESACARAKALVESHDLGGARAELDRAIAATPSLQAAWSLRARVKGMQGEYGGAVADASRAIEL